jgi:hypothetical protein
MDICPNEISKLDEKINIDEQSKMLCNVIVRATQELHVNQDKNKNEIEIFLKNDCQQLKNSKLVEKVTRKKKKILKINHSVFLV